jgi:hypothetical protein
MNPQYLVTDSKLPEESEKRIDEYILSTESTDSLSLTPAEVGHTVFASLAQMVQESLVGITHLYIEPSKSVWNVCARAQLREAKNFNIWICTDIRKDNIETAQIYIDEIKVQGINIGTMFPSTITKINQGIAEALVTANENGFVGRVFENIELLEEELIIKGSLY